MTPEAIAQFTLTQAVSRRTSMFFSAWMIVLGWFVMKMEDSVTASFDAGNNGVAYMKVIVWIGALVGGTYLLWTFMLPRILS